jgi:hypothetical protein
MPGDDEKGAAARKGFAGLSALISDVDAEIAKANEAVKQRPVSPKTSDTPSDPGSLYESSNEEPSREPNQLPILRIGDSWKGMLAIGAIVSIMWFLTYVSGNKSNPESVKTSAPSAVTTRQLSRADPTKNTLVPDLEKFVPVGPLEEKPTIAKPTQERLTEQKPPAGTDNILNEAQIRYCLSENIRLEGARFAVNKYIPAEVARFNLMVDDLNSRCAEFRYKRGTKESIQLEVYGNGTRLLAEGTGRFQNIQGPKLLPAPNSRYADNHQYVEQSSIDSDRKNAQSMPQPQLTYGDAEFIKRSTQKYYELVQSRDIDGAIKCYASERLSQIKRSRIEAIAKDTEYFKIEKIDVIFPGEVGKAKAITLLVHKKYKMPPESWEITLEFIKEAGEWKISGTPGHMIKP